MPWGFICGYPTLKGNLPQSFADVHTLILKFYCFTLGDLYGGAHYVQSGSANLTPQGEAIQLTAQRFGDGNTLPFTPCKRGYMPFDENMTKLCACRIHHRFRWKRIHAKGKFSFRPGEMKLLVFWQQQQQRQEP